jgi:hypothetical protein
MQEAKTACASTAGAGADGQHASTGAADTTAAGHDTAKRAEYFHDDSSRGGKHYSGEAVAIETQAHSWQKAPREFGFDCEKTGRTAASNASSVHTSGNHNSQGNSRCGRRSDRAADLAVSGIAGTAEYNAVAGFH